MQNDALLLPGGQPGLHWNKVPCNRQLRYLASTGLNLRLARKIGSSLNCAYAESIFGRAFSGLAPNPRLPLQLRIALTGLVVASLSNIPHPELYRRAVFHGKVLTTRRIRKGSETPSYRIEV